MINWKTDKPNKSGKYLVTFALDGRRWVDITTAYEDMYHRVMWFKRNPKVSIIAYSELPEAYTDDNT